MKKILVFYLIGYILVVGTMLLLSYVWNDTCNNLLYDGSRCYLIENRTEDIKRVTLCVFEEELVWRLLPILISSVVIIFLKNKWTKRIVILLSVAAIIYMQMIFGAKHWSPLSDFPRYHNILMQGGTGCILAITYICIICLTWKMLLLININSKSTCSKIRNLIICHITAYCASVIVHALSNTIIVITQTF